MYKYLRKVSEKLLLKLLGLQFESKLNTLSTKLPPSPYFLTKSKFFILRSLTTNYLSSTGWWQSCLYSRAINAQGDALPWLTYPAIAFVEKLDLKEKVVLEFGSGASTFYFEKEMQESIFIRVFQGLV